MFNKFNTLRLSLAISLTLSMVSFTSCADSPAGVVNPDETNNIVNPVTSDDITANALKLQGRDALGGTCDLYLTILEDDHNHGSHHVMMKLDYTTPDGHKPIAAEGEFYQYNSSTGQYFDEDDTDANRSLVLLTMSPADSAQTNLDPNSLSDYISNNELAQYMRVEFNSGTDAHDYVHELEEALEADDFSTVDYSVFNKIQFISLGLLHGDHYHFPSCFNYSAVGIEETIFETSEHEDHDHEDEDHEDEDHDHDHDHDDDDHDHDHE